MKKIAFLLMLLMSLGAKAGEPTTDYVYTTGLQYSNTQKKYYFDVALKGERYYCGYGLEISLPKGLMVDKKSNGTPNISRLTAILPYTIEYDEEDNEVKVYSHTVTASFPSDDNNFVRIACMSTANEYFTKKEGNLFRVYVNIDYVNGDWPLGAVKFENVELNMVGQPYDCTNREDIVVVNSGEATLPLNINGNNKWSTCVLPFSAVIPDGVKAYTCSDKKDGESDEDKVVVLTPAESMVAYTPYILYSENGFDDTVTGTVDAVNLPETGVCTFGLLNGAIVPQTITQGYVLQNLSEGVKFYNCGGQTFHIPAGKCWLSPDAGSAKSFAFEIADPTGIKEVNKVIADDSVYTLDGKKVVTPQPNSIYIKSGKKFISK